MIIAGLYGEFTSPLGDAFEGVFYLRLCDLLGGNSHDIPLHPVDDPEEIKDWNLLCDFTSIDGTQRIFNSELHYNVLGEETHYWPLDVAIREEDSDNFRSLVRKKDRKTLPTRYDLILRGKEGEGELVNGNTEPLLREVGLVFSGHAHRNIEFRLEKEWVASNKRHEIRIFSDVYSQLWNAGKTGETWEDYRPVILQTAACGLKGRYDDNPPTIER